VDLGMADKASQQIIEATRNENLLLIRRLLKTTGINVNAQDKDGKTALMWAVIKERLDIVDELLTKGAKSGINLQDKSGHSALILSCLDGNINIIKLLLKNGADVNAQDNHKNTALIMAISSDKKDIKIIKLILTYTKPEFIDIRVVGKNTALILAVLNTRNLDIVNTILDYGANVNLQNNVGYSALESAAHAGDIDIVKTLINHGADVNTKDVREDTPLIQAAIQGHANIVYELLYNTHNAIDVNYQTTKGGTALDAAVSFEHDEIVKILLDFPATNPNLIYNISGNTSLMKAAKFGMVNIVKMFLENRRVLINQYNIFGLSAYLIAAEEGHIDVIRAFHDPTITDREEPNIAPRIGRIVTKVNTFLEDKTIKNPINIEKDAEDSISLERFKEGDEVVRIQAPDDTGKMRDWFFYPDNWIRWVRLKASYDQLPTNPTTGLTVTPDQVDIFTAHIVPPKDEFSMVGGYRHATRKRRRR
jgi:ankyrin repeat protein